MKELIIDNQNQNEFFEGSEKLLEIWFEENTKLSCDLRQISQPDIVDILTLVNCQIISKMSNDKMDSYVLSESSLFVSKQRIILKTCGTTYLLNALKPILKLAYKLGFQEYQLFYSRRRFIYPENQPRIHQNFVNEIGYLDQQLTVLGSAYTFGRLNDEYWNLFMTDNPSILPPTDQTFELIMSNLDPDKMSVFFKKSSENGLDVTKKTGIDQLYPNALIDCYLFDPCGYSMNGLICEDKYFTIHVTPELGYSYASFETNYPETNYVELIQKLLAVFQPEKFFFTLLSNDESPASQFHLRYNRKLPIKNFGYHRKDWQTSVVSNTDLTFAYFVRNPG